jgi:hypothetical protein
VTTLRRSRQSVSEHPANAVRVKMPRAISAVIRFT